MFVNGYKELRLLIIANNTETTIINENNFFILAFNEYTEINVFLN